MLCLIILLYLPSLFILFFGIWPKRMENLEVHVQKLRMLGGCYTALANGLIFY